jgi:hypothetical protein
LLNALPQRRRCAVIRLSVVKRALAIGRYGEGMTTMGMSCHVYPDDDGWLIYFTVADSSQDDREPSSLPLEERQC